MNAALEDLPFKLTDEQMHLYMRSKYSCGGFPIVSVNIVEAFTLYALHIDIPYPANLKA